MALVNEHTAILETTNPSINSYESFKQPQTKNCCKNRCLRCCIYLFIGIGVLSVMVSLVTVVLYMNQVNFQSRLSYNNSTSINELVVTWTTVARYRDNFVTLVDDKQNISRRIYTQSSSYYSTLLFPRYTHRVLLDRLEQGNSYSYRITSGNSESRLFRFKVPDISYMQKILILGDMGLFNSMPKDILIDYALENNVNYVLHLGDIAYDIDSYFGLIGDFYFSSIEKLTSSIPYLTIPGNHESFNNFSSYINTFTMPDYKKNNNLFYSINHGPIKFININTEVYYYNSLYKSIDLQLKFIENELLHTDREVYPWLVITGHRPMYCSNNNNEDCVDFKRDTLRLYLEDILNKFNVTLYISAHEHSYERICPIYNLTCQTRNTSNYIHNKLKNTIHIITGAAGNIEHNDKFKKKTDWSIIRSSLNGFGMIYVNMSELRWVEYGVENNTLYVIDTFKILN